EPVMFNNSAPFQSDPTSVDAADATSFVQTNLVSDVAKVGAEVTDLNLVNPWGVSFKGGSPFWISEQGTNSATLYSVDSTLGVSHFFTVNIPPTAGPAEGPTGQVSNTNDMSFKLTAPNDHDSASFIFADLNGEISAWNSGLGLNG